LTNLVDGAPWTRIEKDGSKLQYTGEKYDFYKIAQCPMLLSWNSDGYWQPKSEGSLIGRHEANAWLAIHQMLLHPELGKHYQVTDYAKGQFMRVRININMLSPISLKSILNPA
jgi:hypothetical protein